MSAFDQAWILKATRDEEAYNTFMRAYNHMMRGRGGLFGAVPDAVRGQDPYAEGDEEWKFLEDLNIWYNPSTGESFEETYDEVEDDYEQSPITIPTPVGAGLEGKVFRIPGTNYVTKIPMPNLHESVRGALSSGKHKPTARVIRSPLEAYWSNVLSHQYPVSPYSVFSSQHPYASRRSPMPSLNLVQEYVDEYHPQFDDLRNMNAIHQHLFDMKDIPLYWEDLQYDMGDDPFPPAKDIRVLAEEDYPLYEDTEMKSNMYGNIILDYISNTPFIEDEYGGLLLQEEIDRLLEAAIYEQERLPKRYRKFGGDIDSRVQTIIDELMESQKQGRLIGSDIDFEDDRHSVARYWNRGPFSAG
jgi:hypothetical protein